MVHNRSLDNEEKGQPSFIPVKFLDDEISLVDLWLVLVKRRKLLFQVFLVAIAGGLVLSTFSSFSPTYSYTTLIEPPRYMVTKEEMLMVALLDTALPQVEDMAVKLARSIVPSVRDRLGSPIAIEVSIPKKTNLLLLESRGAPADEQTHHTLHQSVFQELKLHQGLFLNPLRQKARAMLTQARTELDYLENPDRLRFLASAHQDQIRAAQADLESLREDHQLLAESRRFLLERENLLTENLVEIHRELKEISTNEKDVLQRNIDPLVNSAAKSDIENIEDKLHDYERQLLDALPREKAELNDKLASNRRAQRAQREQINRQTTELAELTIKHKEKVKVAREILAQRQATLSSIPETTALTIGKRSNAPVGARPLLIMASSIAIAVLFALLSVFAAEFAAKARQQPSTRE